MKQQNRVIQNFINYNEFDKTDTLWQMVNMI